MKTVTISATMEITEEIDEIKKQAIYSKEGYKDYICDLSAPINRYVLNNMLWHWFNNSDNKIKG